jgi:hypothetical protein
MIMFVLRCLGELCALCPEGLLTMSSTADEEQIPLAQSSPLRSSDYGIRAPRGRFPRSAVKNSPTLLLFGVPVSGKLFQLLASLIAMMTGLVGFALTLQWLEHDAQAKDVAKFHLVMSRVREQLDNETLRALRPYIVMSLDDPSGDTDLARGELARTLKSWSFFSEAMYYCFVSVTTIGDGEMAPRTTWGKACTVVMFVTMLPVVLTAFTRIASYVSELLSKRALMGQAQFKAVVAKYGKQLKGAINASELKLALHELGVMVSCAALSSCCVVGQPRAREREREKRARERETTDPRVTPGRERRRGG